MKFTIKKEDGRWRWVCTWCRPAARGSRKTFIGALGSLRHHERHRYCHHQWVAAHGRTEAPHDQHPGP